MGFNVLFPTFNLKPSALADNTEIGQAKFRGLMSFASLRKRILSMNHIYLPWALTSEENQSLKRILTVFFESLYTNPSSNSDNYYGDLKNILGLGFFAALLHWTYAEFFLDRLAIVVRAGKLEKLPSPSDEQMNAIVEMIDYGSKLMLFPCNWPAYSIFGDFLKKLLCNERISSLDLDREAQKIYQALMGIRSVTDAE